MKSEQKGLQKITDPIDTKEEVQKSKDKHIDQDFEGYPHYPANEKVIHQKNKKDIKIAGSGNEKEFAHVKLEEERDNKGEILHTGSGGAFEATEEVDHDLLKMKRDKKKKNNKIY